MKKIITVIIVQGMFENRSEKYREREIMLLENMLNIAFPKEILKVEAIFITIQEFFETSKDSDIELVYFSDYYLNNKGMKDIKKIRNQLSNHYLSSAWLAKPGTEKRIAKKIPILSESNAPEEDIENYVYLRKLLNSEYIDY